MSAFQAPLISKALSCKALLRGSTRSALRHQSATRQTQPTKFATRPFRCSFGVPKETTAIPETKCNDLLSDATVVTVQLPLDVYLEEATDGRIFIDEVIPGGNAETSGLLQEGDVIVAVSLPFGEGLFPVPKADGQEMIASHIETREDATFTLAVVRPNDVEELRRQIVQGHQGFASFSQMRNLMDEIHSSDYPIAPPDEEYLSAPDLETLQDYGFELDDVFNVTDRGT